MKNKFLIMACALMFMLSSCQKEQLTIPEQRTAFATTVVVLEAEAAVLYKAVIKSDAAGFTGAGFADYQTPTGDYVEWRVNKTVAASAAILNFRYANGGTYNRPVSLSINGIVVDNNLDFPSTGKWTTWSNALSHSVSLLAGANKIRLTAIGFSGANMDNLSFDGDSDPTDKVPPPVITHPDHIVFVWLENHGYGQIINSKYAPYINSLRAKGTLFTNAYALAHPSYPNYINFFSGANQGVTTNACFTTVPFSTPNLYTVLKGVGKTFAWYSEDLPATGSRVCASGNYSVHHNPMTIFNNVPASQNKMWTQFPTDYTKLESVVCISANKINDMHDGSILTGDNWIKNKLGALVEWCRTHNSIFVIYTDEDNDLENQHIPVIAVGEFVKANYQLGTRYDHFNWTKTILSMFNASETWTGNLSSRNVITGCWQ